MVIFSEGKCGVGNGVRRGESGLKLVFVYDNFKSIGISLPYKIKNN